MGVGGVMASWVPHSSGVMIFGGGEGDVGGVGEPLVLPPPPSWGVTPL